MAYAKQEWKGYPDTSTPITAERLNHIEDGIFEAGKTGGGGAFIGTEPPTEEGVNLWINPEEQTEDTEFVPMVHYTEEEQVIGTYLGKILYQKTIISTTNSSVNAWKTLTSGLNADEIIEYSGFIENSNLEHRILPCTTGNSTVYFQLNKSTKEFQEAHTASGENSKNIIITIKYTKIAD